MVVSGERTRVRTSLGDAMPSLELHLGRSVFMTGRQLSGVVVVRLGRRVNIRALVVSIAGREVPLGQSPRRVAPFFQRDVLLSGRDQPRFTSDKISQYWNAFLGRDLCRPLSEGEHTYPFSIPLPVSLPPSYQGRAGRIVYTVTARVQFPLGRSVQVATEAPIACRPRVPGEEPLVVSESGDWGQRHAGQVDVSVELPSRFVGLGQPVTGRFHITNPRGVEVRQVTVALEMSEGVRSAARKDPDCQTVDFRVIEPGNPVAAVISDAFELSLSSDAPPTVEGTSIAVTWSLRVCLDVSPPLELRVPVVACMLSRSESAQ